MKIGVVYNDKKEDCKDYVLKLRAYCESHDIAVNVATCEFVDKDAALQDLLSRMGDDGSLYDMPRASDCAYRRNGL